jgi:hypothetical protein
MVAPRTIRSHGNGDAAIVADAGGLPEGSG